MLETNQINIDKIINTDPQDFIKKLSQRARKQ